MWECVDGDHKSYHFYYYVPFTDLCDLNSSLPKPFLDFYPCFTDEEMSHNLKDNEDTPTIKSLIE